MPARVVAVSRDQMHRFSKVPCETITLVAGMGVADGRASTSEVTLSAGGGAESIDGVAIVRRAGVMAVVERGGDVGAGLAIDVLLPDGPPRPLQPV